MIGELIAAAASMAQFAVEDDVTFTAGMAKPCFFAAAKSCITCLKNYLTRVNTQSKREDINLTVAPFNSFSSVVLKLERKTGSRFRRVKAALLFNRNHAGTL